MGFFEGLYLVIAVIIILVVTTYIEDFWWNVISDLIIFGTDFFIRWYKEGFRIALQKTADDWHPLLAKIRKQWQERHHHKKK